MKGLKKIVRELNTAAERGAVWIPLYYDISTDTASTAGKGSPITYLIRPQNEKEIETAIKRILAL